MEALTIWFVLLTGNAGYIEPLVVKRAEMVCGIDGTVVGAVVNATKNPTVFSWPDPKVVGKHCSVNIAEKLATLPDGEYENCTTEMGALVPFGTPVESYIGVDPHCSERWTKGGILLKPNALRVGPPPKE